MKVSFNPPLDGIMEIAKSSEHNAAKWIRDKKTGEVIYWRPEDATHSSVAWAFSVDDYDKGISVPKEQ